MGDGLESAKAIDSGLAEDLRAVGIHDLRELRAVGAADAWERLLAADLRDTLASRLALEAAVLGRRRAMLDPATRERCAAHVRRRLAAEPVVVAGRSSFRLTPPSEVSASSAADARQARLVKTIVVVTLVLFVVVLVLAPA